MNQELLTVYAKAGARLNQIYLIDENTIRVEVRERAEKGLANKAIIRLMSDTFGVSASTLKIVRGQTSSIKHFTAPLKVFEKIPSLPTKKKSSKIDE